MSAFSLTNCIKLTQKGGDRVPGWAIEGYVAGRLAGNTGVYDRIAALDEQERQGLGKSNNYRSKRDRVYNRSRRAGKTGVYNRIGAVGEQEREGLGKNNNHRRDGETSVYDRIGAGETGVRPE